MTLRDWKPSFLIGGVAENFGTSFHVQDGTRPFILEGDEYDTAFFDKGPKFLHYFPDAAILTHVEFDHADIYADLEAVKTAFKRMVNLIPRRGRLVAFDAKRERHRVQRARLLQGRALRLPRRLVLARRRSSPGGRIDKLEAAARWAGVRAPAAADGWRAQRTERDRGRRARRRAGRSC